MSIGKVNTISFKSAQVNIVSMADNHGDILGYSDEQKRHV